MQKAIIYTRVSTDRQAKEGLSLEGQEKESKRFCDRKDLVVAKVFREEGESAKTAQRPILLEAIDYCRQEKDIGYFVVWKLDRFARNSTDHAMVRGTLARMGVRLISVTEPIDDTTVGRLTETMLSAINQFDNEVRAERSTKGMAARVEEGGWPFMAPTGYINIKDSVGRPTIQQDDMAPKVAMWLRKFIGGGITQLEAHRLLKSMGILGKNGKQLSFQSAVNMLRNPLYAGLVKSKLIDYRTIKGLHKGLISIDEHRLILDILSNGALKTHSKQSASSWPLRGGFIKCGHCTKPLTGSAPKGRGKYYPMYSCSRCKSSVINKPISQSKDVVHEQFKALLSSIKPDENTLTIFKDVVLRKWNNEFKEAKQLRRKLELQIKKLEERKQRIIDLYIDNKLSDEEKAANTASIDSEILEIGLSKTYEEEQALDKEAVIDYTTNFIRNIDKLWLNADLTNKRRIQNLVMPEGIQYEFGKGFGTPVLGLAFAINQTFSDGKSGLVGVDGIEPSTKWL